MNSPQHPSDELPSPTRRNWVWFSVQVVLRFFFTVWFRYRALGIEKIPATGGGLLLINHQSFLDPLLVGLPLRRPVSFLARDSLFSVPIVGWILRNTYVMPISRESAGASSVREAVARIQHGFLVGIFPEGTRSRDGTVGEFKPGFISLVRRAHVPVYPVGIAGANEAFPRGRWLIRPRKVFVVFGDPFSADELERLQQRGHEQEFLSVARERVCECQRLAESFRQVHADRPRHPAAAASWSWPKAGS